MCAAKSTRWTGPESGITMFKILPRKMVVKTAFSGLLGGVVEVFKKELYFEQRTTYISTQLISLRAIMAKQSGKSAPKSEPAKSSPTPKKAPSKNSDASGKDNQAEKRSRGTGAKDTK